MVRGYDKQAEYLSWGPRGQYRDDYHQHNGKVNLPTGTILITKNRRANTANEVANKNILRRHIVIHHRSQGTERKES